MWVDVDSVFGVWDADVGEGLDCDFSSTRTIDILVEQDGFAYLVADGVDGAQGGHGLLEDHADHSAAEMIELVVLFV